MAENQEQTTNDHDYGLPDLTATASKREGRGRTSEASLTHNFSSSIQDRFVDFGKKFLGAGPKQSSEAGTGTRIGLCVSGGFLVSVGLYASLTSDLSAQVFLPLILLGASNICFSKKKRLSLGLANTIALAGHLVAAIALYLFISRVVWVTYRTDSIIATYMGILKVLSLQNPYAYSIKPLMDQFQLPPTIYTPHLDGSFELHLNYGALNYLTLLPFYIAGWHDLRDSVFVFHILSVLLVFGFVPRNQKALSLAPFAFFPAFVAASWTDSLWAFFLVLSPILWYRNRNAGLAMVALAGATKQIALLAAPLLLVRVWRESGEAKIRNTLAGTAIIAIGFLGPTLPFILASPAQWWASTVTPYVPGAAAMVSGGVGLSEILLDIGIAPSPLFFFILMATVSVVLLQLYLTRFSKSACFVWVFPVVILFFYHRSFPNYLFYWIFPTAIEFFTHRPNMLVRLPNLRNIMQPGLVKGIIPRPRLWQGTPRFRSMLTGGTLVALLTATTLVGTHGFYMTQTRTPRIDVQINQISDPDQVGLTTTLNITLTNLSQNRLKPLFFVKWDWLPYLWTSNPAIDLGPWATTSYIISASDGLSALPRSSNFRLYVFDANTGEMAGESTAATADTVKPELANPCFKWWTLDLSAGTRVPVGWRLDMINQDPIVGSIEPSNQTAGDGVDLRLNYSSPEEGSKEISISQQILLNSANLGLRVLESKLASTGHAELGATVTDGVRKISYLFTNVTSRTLFMVSSQEERISLPILDSVWNNIPINASEDWTAQGWALPGYVSLAIYLKGGAPGFYSANISQIAPCYD